MALDQRLCLEPRISIGSLVSLFKCGGGMPECIVNLALVTLGSPSSCTVFPSVCVNHGRYLDDLHAKAYPLFGSRSQLHLDTPFLRVMPG